MTKTFTAAGLAFVVLCACDDGSSQFATTESYQPGVVADVAYEPMQSAPQAKRVAPDTPSEGTAGTTPQLAYAYDAALELPAGQVAVVANGHRGACENAGFATCQVLTAAVGRASEDNVTASLRFRATAAYTDAFRDGLSAEAENAGGELSSIQMRAEDLTAQISDTAARLEAQETLRDRLLDLLDRDTDDINALLQTERELARVQGEIEAAMARLRYLRGRVSMNTMSVDYQSIYEPFTPSRRRPLTDAITGFFGVLAESLGVVVTFVAAALPWLLVALPILWLLRRFLRRRAGARSA